MYKTVLIQLKIYFLKRNSYQENENEESSSNASKKCIKNGLSLTKLSALRV